MEPISATASILTIIGVAGPLVKGLQRVKSLGHAKAEISSLLKDLAGLRIVIQQVQNVILDCSEKEYPGGQTTEALSSLQQLLDTTKASVLELDGLVHYTLTKTSSSGDVKVDLVGWIKDKSKLALIQRDICSARDNLGIALASLNS
jgi:hypothetical protein